MSSLGPRLLQDLLVQEGDQTYPAQRRGARHRHVRDSSRRPGHQRLLLSSEAGKVGNWRRALQIHAEHTRPLRGKEESFEAASEVVSSKFKEKEEEQQARKEPDMSHVPF